MTASLRLEYTEDSDTPVPVAPGAGGGSSPPRTVKGGGVADVTQSKAERDDLASCVRAAGTPAGPGSDCGQIDTGKVNGPF